MKDRYDVAVLGGGVIGLCSALYLRRSGASVCVLEKGRFLDGASMGNAGLLVPSHIEPIAAPGVIAQGLKWLADPESPFYIKPRIDMELTRWLWGFQAACTRENVDRAIPILRDLALESLRLHDELADLDGFENVGLSHSGLFVLHNSDKSRKANLALADAAEAAGLRIERLTRDETLEKDAAIRTPVSGSVFFEEDALFDPERFMHALLGHVRDAGVDLLDESEIVAFESADRSVRGARTEKGVVRAGEYVLAAGAWSGLLGRKLGFRLPIQPATGYSLTVEDPGTELRHPVIVTDQKVTVTPMPGRLRIGGTLTLVGFDETVDERRVEPLRRQIRLYCPDIAGGKRTMPDTWSGFRPCTNDGLPVIGRPEAYDNLIVAAGHGMLGMTEGPVTGRIVAELHEGKPSGFDLSLVSPDRF